MLRNAYAVLQSESEVDVLGLMTAMQSNFDVLNKPVELTYGVDLQREKNSHPSLNCAGYQLPLYFGSYGALGR